MTVGLSRTLVFPEKTLPDAAGLIAEGRAMAKEVMVGRAHFFAAAAEAMRRILVENARRKGRIHHDVDVALDCTGERPIVQDQDLTWFPPESNAFPPVSDRGGYAALSRG